MSIQITPRPHQVFWCGEGKPDSLLAACRHIGAEASSWKGVVVKIRISLGFGDLFTKCTAHVIQLVTESLESSSSMYKASSAWVAIA